MTSDQGLPGSAVQRMGVPEKPETTNLPGTGRNEMVLPLRVLGWQTGYLKPGLLRVFEAEVKTRTSASRFFSSTAMMRPGPLTCMLSIWARFEFVTEQGVQLGVDVEKSPTWHL